VSHEVLVSRLEHYGVIGIILNQFRFYLNDRRQRVYLEYSATHYFQSDWESIKCGVPQGSVLDPTLFNIHINDLTKIMDKFSHTVLYADDTNIIVASTNYNDLQKKKKNKFNPSIHL